MTPLRFWAALAALGALSACAVTPTTIVQRPTSTRPAGAEASVANNGAIYQLATYRPFFEDKRARHVGDAITITILENSSAVTAGANAGNKSGSVGFNVPGPLQGRFGASVATATGNKFADGDNRSASNTFTGTIGVTVAEVLANGNLVVSGEKQIALNRGVEFIRFSGVINPDTIAVGNTVPSTQVADARIEYRTNSQLDRAEVNSMASRFFQSVLPF